MGKACYIHIPFCSEICHYCDFTKLIYREDWAADYIEALKSEIRNSGMGECLTLYIGGGTPSCLSLSQLDDLLSFVSPFLFQGGEFTIEANPESLSEGKAILFAKYGVNRVSLGMQSSSRKLLSLMGRRHDFADVEKAVRLLKKHGIENISVDLIYALPGETDEELLHDLDSLLSLNVDHISTYSLILEQGTLFFAKGLKEAESDEQARQFDLIKERLLKEGYEHYEISSFARNSRQSAHNTEYWKDHEYCGFGLGASGYIDGKRYRNTKNLSKYLKGDLDKEIETVSIEDDIKYFLLTNLRLKEGFADVDFAKRFGFSFYSRNIDKINTLKSRGLLEEKEGIIAPTERGMMLLDSILLMFF